VRKTWLSVVLLGVALVVQLTLVNGLHVPGGGVPDLVLILVVALGIATGPVPGVVTGFAAGLCLDLAPPDSGLIGQYALVFCLAGWAAGQLAGSARRAPLPTLVAGAVLVAVAEVVTAALDFVLVPAEVTIAGIRQSLPATIAYDVLLFPFALYLVMVAAGALGSAAADSKLAGSGHSALRTAPAGSRRTERRHRRPEPRLNPAAARTRDGWVGGGSRDQVGRGRQPQRRTARLHPGAGVAGSAAGFSHARTLPATVVHLRLGSPRPGDGVIGNVAGRGMAGHTQPSRRPGVQAGASGRFRPHAGEVSASAARQHAPAGTGLPQAKINFAAHRGDASFGQRVGTDWRSVPASARGAGLKLRPGTGRSALTAPRPTGRPAQVPRLNFRTASPQVVRRPAATPKFRRASRQRPSGQRSSRSATALVAGGVLDHSTFRVQRRNVGLPRLRLAGRGPGAGMIGGSGRSPLRQPPARSRHQPRFSYGRRSVLSFLSARHIGGRWLARKRAGSRSTASLIGARTGGVR
jgi:rod shape-determining protein MreD